MNIRATGKNFISSSTVKLAKLGKKRFPGIKVGFNKMVGSNKFGNLRELLEENDQLEEEDRSRKTKEQELGF